jgi:hypothetical protein
MREKPTDGASQSLARQIKKAFFSPTVGKSIGFCVKHAGNRH